MTQTCGCHHRTESKKKLDLHLAYLFVDKIAAPDTADGQTVNLGIGLLLTLALAT